MKISLSITLLALLLFGAASCTGQTGNVQEQNSGTDKEMKDTPPIYLGLPAEMDAEDYSLG